MKVRFPADLHDQIGEAAKANHRSMNAEIVARLQTSFGDVMADGDPAGKALAIRLYQQELDNVQLMLDWEMALLNTLEMGYAFEDAVEALKALGVTNFGDKKKFKDLRKVLAETRATLDDRDVAKQLDAKISYLESVRVRMNEAVASVKAARRLSEKDKDLDIR